MAARASMAGLWIRSLQRTAKFKTSSRSFSAATSLNAARKLFTPGPLGVSMTTKQAMLRDLGSREAEFVSIVKHIRECLLELAGVSRQTYTCVPMQGSGTFGLEAVFGTVVPRDGKVLILGNGAYGKRQARICEVLGIQYHLEIFPENQQVLPSRVQEILQDEGTPISAVATVHCETSSGVVNPVSVIGKIVKNNNPDCVYVVDAMSSFGAVPLDLQAAGVDYLVTATNKCLEGVPGFSIIIANTEHLLSCEGNARSLSLDVVDQYHGLERTGQFRFTPPTHSMLALKQALHELKDEGGIEARAKRYRENREVLRVGMHKLGFQEFLDDSHDGYIITSYRFPKHKNFRFAEFYQRLAEKGQIIYPGKVLNADCFRIGNIGHVFPEDVSNLLGAIRAVCQDMNIELPLPDNGK